MMNQYMKTQQLYKMSEKVAKELETIFGCDVITSCFPKDNIMQFYIFINSTGSPNKENYKIVIAQLNEEITNSYVYVQYLINCLNSKIFVKGNVFSKSTVVYDIKDYIDRGFDIYFKKIDDAFYQGNRDLFCINEKISLRSSLEYGTFFIQDKSYGNVLINFNTNIFTIEEVA